MPKLNAPRALVLEYIFEVLVNNNNNNKQQQQQQQQRVKAKWNSDFRFGGKSAPASNKASHAASKSLLFSFVLDTFQAISVIFLRVQAHEGELSDLWICR